LSIKKEREKKKDQLWVDSSFGKEGVICRKIGNPKKDEFIYYSFNSFS
jgi:hypothetical protein